MAKRRSGRAYTTRLSERRLEAKRLGAAKLRNEWAILANLRKSVIQARYRPHSDKSPQTALAAGLA